MYSVCVIKLKVDILDDEGPNFVAETVGIKMSLQNGISHTHVCAIQADTICAATHLERQPRLHLVCKHFCNSLVEVYEDLHRQLGLDAALGDEVVKSVREGTAETTFLSANARRTSEQAGQQYLLRR